MFNEPSKFVIFKKYIEDERTTLAEVLIAKGRAVKLAEATKELDPSVHRIATKAIEFINQEIVARSIVNPNSR